MFARLRPNDNLYAHPCDFVPVIDSHTGEVLSVDYPPTNPAPGEAFPPSSAEAYEASEKRAPFAPPMAPHNYLPEQIMIDEPEFKLRDTLKPLHVIQPEGVSYVMEGRVLKWQNWNIHVGFSYRFVLSACPASRGILTRCTVKVSSCQTLPTTTVLMELALSSTDYQWLRWWFPTLRPYIPTTVNTLLILESTVLELWPTHWLWGVIAWAVSLTLTRTL